MNYVVNPDTFGRAIVISQHIPDGPNP